MTNSRPKLSVGARQRLLDSVDSAVAAKYRSRKALADAADIKPTTLQQILSGDGDVGASLLARLCEAMGLSVDFILTGKLAREADTQDTVPIRILDLAYGMGGAFIGEHVEEEIEFFPRRMIATFTKAPADKLRLVRGIGDSMMPTISDGDLILIDLSQDAMRMNDQIWALATGEIGMIKRLRVTGGGTLQAISDNPNVSDFTIAEDDYRIVGRVVACLRSL